MNERMSKKQANKEKLNELLSRHDMRDLRFAYFNAPEHYKVAAVTKLYRNDQLLIVAFSFCSPKDNFSKKLGKIQCLERISNVESLDQINPEDLENLDIDCKYTIKMPFAKMTKMINIAIAYNLIIDKPLKLRNTKFYIQPHYGKIEYD